MKLIAIAAAAVLMTGCATDMSKYYEVQGKAIEADNNAVMALAAAAAQGNQGAIVALALRQGQAGKIAPPQDKALEWARILVPEVRAGFTGYWNKEISLKQIDANTAQQGMIFGTIGGIASQGIDAASKPPVIVNSTPAGSSVIYPVAD